MEPTPEYLFFPYRASLASDSGRAVPSGIWTMPMAFSRQRSETLLTLVPESELPTSLDDIGGSERRKLAGPSPKSCSRKACVLEPPLTVEERDSLDWLLETEPLTEGTL